VNAPGGGLGILSISVMKIMGTGRLQSAVGFKWRPGVASTRPLRIRLAELRSRVYGRFGPIAVDSG